MKQESDCGFYIKHINDALQREVNNALRAKDLTIAQLTVLLLLENTAHYSMTLKELEKQLHVAQSTAAGIVVRLEQKGFVEAFGSAEDKRIKMLRLTEAGLDCCADTQSNMQQAEQRLLSGLTETECVLFRSLLKKVSDTF